MTLAPLEPPSRPARRAALRQAARVLALFAGVQAITPREAAAQLAAWDAAFAARDFRAAWAALGGDGAQPEPRVQLDAPALADNGAVVPVTLASSLPEVSLMALLVEHNPGPLSAVFELPPGTQAFVATRLKFAESSTLHALVRSSAGLFLARRPVQVVLGGCAG